MDNFEFKPLHDVIFLGEDCKFAIVKGITDGKIINVQDEIKKGIEKSLEDALKIDIDPTFPSVGVGRLTMKPTEDYKITNKHKFYENDVLALLNEFVMNHF